MKMTRLNKPTLTLLVTNTQQLEAGKSAQFSWSNHGGTIGSSTSDTWYLQDGDGQVFEQHCEVLFVDNDFCIKDLSGETYINGSLMPVGRGKLVRLKQKDEIQLGNLCLRTLVEKSKNDDESDLRLETLLLLDKERLVSTETPVWGREEQQTVNILDPIIILEEQAANLVSQDITDHGVSNIQKSSSVECLIPKTNHLNHKKTYSFQANNEFEITSSIILKKNSQIDFKNAWYADFEAENHTTHAIRETEDHLSKGITMDEKELDLLEEEVAKSVSPTPSNRYDDDLSVSHLVAGPVLLGLGVNVSQSTDMHSMQLLSKEFGESIQACIHGLIELHQQMKVGRYGSMNRRLQPIEDNPLRLGLGYEETIQTLYDADRSMVHLSAPAAIAESLKNIGDHNAVVQSATSEALHQLLEAFSPQVLLRRFQQYRRNTEQSSASHDTWAWDMYCSYHQELTSQRQNGFENLFWEIFEQSYDRKIREKQREL
ncbi:type VI secretion system-associated FHA domain protein TagH [Vibrio diazotrophicus]|uniref:type VI secretion system-associated FHA domain protein TagH n=3 Tax=Vibrio TaxID=662 RepID=UPI000AC15DB9|nr:type VI secretion system-associated FHA domain protein TagH [Vibrio diazotrophicus]